MNVLSVLSDPLVDAFEEQATSELFARARRHAQWCLTTYRLPGGHGADADLVQAALVDIFERRIAWDPAEESLLNKVCDVIRYRARDERVSLRGRASHVPIDAPRDDGDDRENDDGETSALLVDAERGALVEDPEVALRRAREREVGARLGAELATLAAGDAHVASLVRCLRAGLTKKAEICAEVGMSGGDYHNAVRRFSRLTQRLPAELRALAEDYDR